MTRRKRSGLFDCVTVDPLLDVTIDDTCVLLETLVSFDDSDGDVVEGGGGCTAAHCDGGAGGGGVVVTVALVAVVVVVVVVVSLIASLTIG